MPAHESAGRIDWQAAMPAAAQPALPGMKTAANAARKRRTALTWSADEVQFAGRLLATWNAALGDCRRAYKTRRNQFVAIAFYRRNESRPPEDRITTAQLGAAIRAYASDPANAQMRRWKSFHDWIADAEDNIAAQLARIKHASLLRRGRADREAPLPQRNRTPTPLRAAAAPPGESPLAAAQRLLHHKHLAAHAETASRRSRSLRDYLDGLTRMRRASPLIAQAARERLDLIDGFDAAGETAQESASMAARTAFEAIFRHPPRDHLDAARLSAMTIAAWDLSRRTPDPSP